MINILHLILAGCVFFPMLFILTSFFVSVLSNVAVALMIIFLIIVLYRLSQLLFQLVIIKDIMKYLSNVSITDYLIPWTIIAIVLVCIALNKYTQRENNRLHRQVTIHRY